jgi:hypothetical protein
MSESKLLCPRCAKELKPSLDHCHRHVCDDPWVYTAEAESGTAGRKRAVQIEYVTTSFYPLAVPVDIGIASDDSVLGQPPGTVTR